MPNLRKSFREYNSTTGGFDRVELSTAPVALSKKKKKIKAGIRCYSVKGQITNTTGFSGHEGE